MLGGRKTNFYLHWYGTYYCYRSNRTVLKLQCMAGAGAGAENMDKGGAGAGFRAENK